MKHTYIHQAKNVYDYSVKLAVRNILRGSAMIAGLATFMFFQACDPTQLKKEDFGTVPAQSQISIKADPEGDFRFLVTAKAPSYGIAKWDFGNGITWSGSANIADTAYYPLPGTYKIKLALYTRAGVVYDSTTVTTTKYDYAYFNTDFFNWLTGGINATDGKTWVLDSLHWGHLGVGATDATWPNWWGAGTLEKKGKNIYDDQVIFTLNGFKFTYINNGVTYANNGVYTQLGGIATQETGGSDFLVQYTPPTNSTWWAVTSGGKTTIKLSNGGFMMYYTGAPFEYEVISLSNDILYLRQNVGWGYWYFRLIRQGYTYQ